MPKPLSGRSGTLHLFGAEVTPIRNWSLSISGNLKDYAANDTGGWKRRVEGTNDATGSFQLAMDPTQNCPVEKGDSVIAEFHVDDSGLNYYRQRIAIDTVEVETDIDDGDIINYEISFGADGPLVPYGILSKGAGGSSSA